MLEIRRNRWTEEKELKEEVREAKGKGELPQGRGRKKETGRWKSAGGDKKESRKDECKEEEWKEE